MRLTWGLKNEKYGIARERRQCRNRQWEQGSSEMRRAGQGQHGMGQ